MIAWNISKRMRNAVATRALFLKTLRALERAEVMKQYKGHPIYGIAIPAPEHGWCSRGLVYDQDLTQTIEIKRIESPTDLTFEAKEQAEEHGLKLCRDWIDEQNPPAI